MLADTVPFIREELVEKFRNKKANEATKPVENIKDSILDKLIQKNRKRIEKEEKQFIEAVDSNRPKFDSVAARVKFDKISRKSSKHIYNLVMQVLATANAVAYANEELQFTLNSDEEFVNVEEINRFSRGFTRLRLLRHIGRIYGIENSVIEAIINLQVVKDFGTIPLQQRTIAPVSRPVERSNGKKPVRPKVPPFGTKEKSKKG